MLPYYPQPAISFGHWHVTAFAFCGIAALILARWMVLRRARRFGIGYDEIAPVYLVVIVAALVCALLPGVLTASGLSSLGAVMGGILGGSGYCLVQRYSREKMFALLEVLAFAAPFAGAMGRLGCTLAHDHRGLPSGGWFAFRFPEGGRYDLGFVDFLFLAGLSAAFVLLDAKQRCPLFFLGTAACAYGSFRLWRETLDVSSRYLPWAAVLALGIAALIVGSRTTLQPQSSPAS